MNRLLGHAAAAARRTVRQVARSRLLLLAVAGAAALVSALLPDVPDAARVVGAAAMTLHFAIVVTTTGVPGDDLASGALANVVAALPSALAVGVLAGPRLSGEPSGMLAVSLIIVALGGAAIASTAVALGTVFPGRAATVLMLVVVIGGEVPPSMLPLDHYPPALAAAARETWSILPLPHQVRAGVGALTVGQPVAPHALPLLVGTIAAVAAGTLVLRLRIATGRWS